MNELSSIVARMAVVHPVALTGLQYSLLIGEFGFAFISILIYGFSVFIIWGEVVKLSRRNKARKYVIAFISDWFFAALMWLASPAFIFLKFVTMLFVAIYYVQINFDETTDDVETV